MPRPNILLITSDQQRADAVSWENPLLKTPNLDRLRKRGVTFSRAYTCNPVCTPTRCSLLTGHYPSRHGAYTIGCNLPEDYPTVPEQLRSVGYYTALAGKAHFSSCCTEGSFESPPNIFNEAYFRRWEGSFYGFERARINIDHGPRTCAAGMHYRTWLRDKGVNPDDYFSDERYAYWSYGSWDLPPDLSQSAWVAEETLASMDAAAETDRPFFIWSSFADPHNPCWASEPYASLYGRAEMPIYNYREGEMDDRPPFYQSIIEGMDHTGEPNLHGDKAWFCVNDCPHIKSDSEKREIAALYYGMISQMDHYIGKILDALEARGQLDNTLIIFTSDHGEYLGHHGMWGKGLPAYEDAQRIPMLVVDPKTACPNSQSAALQSNIDIPTTVLAQAGLGMLPLQQGVDQTEVWRGQSESNRDEVLIEFRPTESRFMQTTLVEQRYKLVVYHPNNYGEIYDLQSDPEQTRNLWDHPQHAELKARLIHRMAQAQMEKDGTLRERTMWA